MQRSESCRRTSNNKMPQWKLPSRSLQEATVRYKAGLDPYLNVIAAQTVLLNDQQTAVNFRMEQMVAAVGLIKALGGGWNASEIPSPKDVGIKTIDSPPGAAQ